MSAQAVASTGLVLDMVGAFVIWLYGLPPQIDPQGHIHIICEQIDESERLRAQRYIRLSRCGLLLLILGFALQLFSNFI
jgi:hypothetical protein